MRDRKTTKIHEDDGEARSDGCDVVQREWGGRQDRYEGAE